MNGSPHIDSRIDVSVDWAFQPDFPKSWLRAAVKAVLGVALAEGERCQVSLLVTGDETVRGLNRDYRGLDEVTDVLSFSSSHAGHWQGEVDQPKVHRQSQGAGDGLPFVYPPDEPPPLGEVVISYPQAQRQASANGVPLYRELAQLIVHGVLHLVGHDHLEPQEEAKMQAMERAALATIQVLEIPHIRTTIK